MLRIWLFGISSDPEWPTTINTYHVLFTPPRVLDPAFLKRPLHDCLGEFLLSCWHPFCSFRSCHFLDLMRCLTESFQTTDTVLVSSPNSPLMIYLKFWGFTHTQAVEALASSTLDAADYKVASHFQRRWKGIKCGSQKQ